MNLDYLRLAGVMKDKAYVGPQTVAIYLNRRCNLKCVYCTYNYLCKVSWSKAVRKKINAELDYKLFRELLSDMVEMKIKRIVCSSHGEPLLHSNFMGILSDIKSNGLNISLLTNGTLLTKNIIRKFTKGDSLSIHVSSFKPDTYARLQNGSKKNLKNVIRNIMEISKNEDRPAVKMVVPVHYQNFKEMEHYLKFSKIIGADYVDFKWMESPGDFSFFLKAFNMNERDIFSHPKRVLAVKKELERLLNSKTVRVIRNNVQDLYNASFINTPPPSCLIGWFRTYVDIDGSVHACCINKKFYAGNLKEKPFKEIWFSEKYNEIRKSLKYEMSKRKNMLRACKMFCAFDDNKKLASAVKRISAEKKWSK